MIRYYDKIRYRRLPLVRALFAANFLFVVSTLLSWQFAFIYLLGPMTWAVDRSLPFERDLIHILDYPLVLFWSGPACAVAIASVLVQGNNHRAAFGVLVLPLLVLALTLGMYWIVPDARPAG